MAASRAQAPCQRTYHLPTLRHDELAAVITAKHPLCHGPKNARVCGLPFADHLGLGAASIPTYSEGQRTSFLARFAGLPAKPSPWLSLGGRLNSAAHQAGAPDPQSAYFYSNAYVDLFLFRSFFSSPRPVVGGSYVEIGGSNGVHASNTLFFEQSLNWTGVLIEPTACGRCMLPYSRPRDHTLNAGACREFTRLNGTLLVAKQWNAAGTFCPYPQDSCVRNAPGGISTYSVPCEPMRAMLPKEMTHIDLLSVDVEEKVMNVLETMPWGRVSIDVILAECHGSELLEACARLLKHHGYRVIGGTTEDQAEQVAGDLLAVREACLV